MPCAKLTPKIRNVDGGDVGVYRCDQVGHSFLFLIWLCREKFKLPGRIAPNGIPVRRSVISTRDAMQENFYDPALSWRLSTKPLQVVPRKAFFCRLHVP